MGEKEEWAFFFLESGDRWERGPAVAHKINHPGFIISFMAALDVRWDAWTEMAQSWILFLFAMCCKIATMSKRIAFREGYDICFSGIEF